ncbi:sporulation integral membrane protein YtvI [Desulfofalx alkaliphila]|uniref:sporulation integral membrane protein YtvI n=1 Tax=Desulfofalx alkaliphila TaxID=105483 RepID=UPI0004E1A8D2|nr:sporulation integral membrane protein YtvI [Desulfofalx alkaliphila]
MVPGWYRPAINTIVLVAAVLLSLALAGLFIWLAGYLFPALLPFILAAFIAFMMEPLINLLQNRLRLGRGPAVGLSMLLVFGGLGTAFTYLVVQLLAELIAISQTLPDAAREVRMYLESLIPVVMRFYGDLPVDMISYLQDLVRNLTAMLQSLVEIVVASLLAVLSLVPGTFVGAIVTFLATYFIAKDRRRIANFWLKIVPTPHGQNSLNVLREVLGAFWGYLKAQGILVAISTTICIIGLYIIGVDYALTVGLVVGLFDIIPVLGPSTLFIPWLVWLFFTGNYVFGLKVAILYVLIMAVRQLLEARVVAHNLGLHPLAVLMAMFMGLQLIGFLGLILGPILLIAIQAALKAGNILQRVK